MAIRAPRCIRFFKTRSDAEWGKHVLEKAGIEATITEDHFEKLTLADLGMESRFRLIIDQDNIEKAAKFLALELKKERKKIK